MATVCNNCGSDEIDTDLTRGVMVCTECGNCLGENVIVSEVSFAESSGGQSSVVGQFVSMSGTKGLSSSARGGAIGYSQESREITISKGRRSIQQLASRLGLNNHHVEAALRMFVLAIENKFIQGRKTQNVIAACLYTVCRREKTSHMLIDFSEILRTNIFVLGSTFLKFISQFNLNLPIIDPSLFIHRFANRLAFKKPDAKNGDQPKDESHLVANTALRLVSQMKRDWMSVGRRPSGICGASLVIAARMHGYDRTLEEVCDVVKVCEATLKERVEEFLASEASALTVEEMKSIEGLDEGDVDPLTGKGMTGQDPPSYTQNRLHDWEHLHGLTNGVEDRLISQFKDDYRTAMLEFLGDEDEAEQDHHRSEGDSVVAMIEEKKKKVQAGALTGKKRKKRRSAKSKSRSKSRSKKKKEAQEGSKRKKSKQSPELKSVSSSGGRKKGVNDDNVDSDDALAQMGFLLSSAASAMTQAHDAEAANALGPRKKMKGGAESVIANDSDAMLLLQFGDTLLMPDNKAEKAKKHGRKKALKRRESKIQDEETEVEEEEETEEEEDEEDDDDDSERDEDEDDEEDGGGDEKRKKKNALAAHPRKIRKHRRRWRDKRVSDISLKDSEDRGHIMKMYAYRMREVIIKQEQEEEKERGLVKKRLDDLDLAFLKTKEFEHELKREVSDYKDWEREQSLAVDDIPIDEEIRASLLSEEEVKNKTNIWTQANADYLKAIQERDKLEAEQLAMGITPARIKARRRKVAEASGEAAKEALRKAEEKKQSSKINRNILDSLFDTEQVDMKKATPLGILDPSSGKTRDNVTVEPEDDSDADNDDDLDDMDEDEDDLEEDYAIDDDDMPAPSQSMGYRSQHMDYDDDFD